MATSWGVTSTGGIGIVQTLDVEGTAETAKVRGPTGLVVQTTAYSKTKTVSFEGYFDGAALIEPGTSLVIGGITGLVTSITTSESNTDFKKVKGTVELSDASTITALGSGS